MANKIIAKLTNIYSNNKLNNKNLIKIIIFLDSKKRYQKEETLDK